MSRREWIGDRRDLIQRVVLGPRRPADRTPGCQNVGVDRYNDSGDPLEVAVRSDPI